MSAVLLRHAFAMLLFLSFSANAQPKIPVYIDATIPNDDSVGNQYVFEVKEAIRASQSFRLVEITEWPRITVVIVTVGVKSASTAVSLSYLYDSLSTELDGTFITASVHNCGRDRVQSCARAVLGHIDRAVEQLKARAPQLQRALVAR